MSEASAPRTGVIVVGVDGSDSSKDALAWAAHQAELTGSSLEAVMTWHVPTVLLGPVLPFPDDFNPADECVRELGQAVASTLGEHPRVTVSTVVVEGHPALALVEAAGHADLLVVGSRGHGAFTGMLVGSVSEYCVSHAPCPVVVVRHTADPV